MEVSKVSLFTSCCPEAHRDFWRHVLKKDQINALNDEQKNILSSACLFIYTNTLWVTKQECIPILLQFVKAGLNFNQCIEGLVFVKNRGNIFGGEENAIKIYLEIIKDENDIR